MVAKPLFEDNGSGISLLAGVTPEELTAWELANNMKWTGTELVPVISQAEIIQQFTDALTAHVLALCRSRLYDGPQSFKLYADANPLPDSPTFAIEMAHKAECTIAAEWYPKFWAKATWIMGEVLAGRHAMPESVEALIAELPALEW